jgi:polyisoprenoid-binding protein YceI
MSDLAVTDLGTVIGTWILDPSRTVIRFRTKIFRLITVNGTFRVLEGQASVAVNGALHGSVSIDAASIDTKIAKRDNHLRDPDFFDVENYPKIIFTATNARFASEGQAILGNLEIRGQTRPLTLRAEVSNTGDSLRFVSEVDLDRRDWGMSYAAQVRSSTRIHVDITAYFDPRR